MNDDTPTWPDRTSAGEDLARRLPMFWRPGEAITVIGIPGAAWWWRRRWPGDRDALW